MTTDTDNGTNMIKLSIMTLALMISCIISTVYYIGVWQAGEHHVGRGRDPAGAARQDAPQHTRGHAAVLP